MRRIVFVVLLLLCLRGVASAQAIGGLGQPQTYTPFVGTTLQSAALEGSHVFKTAPANLFGFHVLNHTAAAKWVMIFNATSLPANGAVTPIDCYPLPAGAASGPDGIVSSQYFNPPNFSLGIVIAVSTNTAGCFSLTVDGANNFIWAETN